MQSTNGNINMILIFYITINKSYYNQTLFYDVLSSTLVVDLPIGDPLNTYLCADGTAPPCKSVSTACKNIGITLQSLGYDTSTSQSTSLTMTFSMIGVSTALAINFGMNSLSNLQQVMGDNDRATLLTKMKNFGYINDAIFKATSSYYDAFYTPASIVYCTNWELVNPKYKNLASCFVRVGNTLMYPLVVSSGYNHEEGSMPNRCTKKAVESKTKATADAAGYYCNLMNFNIGFVYYPTEDLVSNPTAAPTTYQPGTPTMKPTTPHPTKRPTKSPDYQPYVPGSPTMKPTFGAPTPIPTFAAPTPIPTFANPTKSPTRRPTEIPTAIPTRPTKAPTARRKLQDNLQNISELRRALQTDNSNITFTLKYCPKYTASNTNNATKNYVSCTFNACPNQYVLISTCYYETGNTTTGDTYLKLYSSNKFLAENDNDPYCSPYTGDSYIGFVTSGSSGCKDYQIRQGCYQNTTCSSSTTIYLLDIPPYYQFDDDYEPQTFDDNPYSGGNIGSVDDFTSPPVPMNTVVTDDYGVASHDDFRGQLTDDFVINAVVESVDNGLIFSFALVYSNKLLISLMLSLLLGFGAGTISYPSGKCQRQCILWYTRSIRCAISM